MWISHLAIVGQWVLDNDIFIVHQYVGRGFLDVCHQVFHVGKTWEQFSIKYQDEGK